MAEELAYKRKARLRGKHRKVRIEQVYDPFNLRMADQEARKGKCGIKKAHKGVRTFDRHAQQYLQDLHIALRDATYHTSPGHECERLCPCGKKRILHKLPYYPDHITYHALMRVIMPTLTTYYYYDSSASIKGKGMLWAAKRTARWIDENKDAGRLYYVKADFVKFYHNIHQDKIYEALCKVFTDKGIRYLLHEAITACESGLGIGLYPIQPLANFYTCILCRLLMWLFNVRVEIYCDDIVIMGRNKKEVWQAVNFLMHYASDVMEQPLHDNIGMQIIDETHCLDFVGYKFYFNHTLLRNRIKDKFKRKMHNMTNPVARYRAASSYKGWLMHCNGYTLWCKVMNMKSFSEMGVPTFEKRDPEGKRILEGTKVSAGMICDREIVFMDVEFGVKSKFKRAAAVVQVQDNGQKYKFFTNNQKLIQVLEYVNTHDGFPFRGTLYRTNTTGLPDYAIK